MPAKIIFTILPDGKVEERVEGVAGESCAALTRPIEEALGGQMLSRDNTPEYYQQAINEQENSGG